VLKFVFAACILLPLIGSSLNFLPVPPVWLEELNLFYSSYYLLHHIVSLVALLSLRSLGGRFLRGICLSLAVLLSAGYLLRLKPFFFPPSPSIAATEVTSETQKLRTIFIHLDAQAQAKQLVDYLHKEQFDVVAIAGWNAAWADKLAALDQLPYRHQIAREDGYGLALLSRYALTEDSSPFFGEGLPPVLHVVIEPVPGQAIHAVVLKTPPPFSAEDYHIAKLLVRRLSTPYRHTSTPTIFFTHLNAPQSSLSYARLRKAARLSNVMWGFGLPRTWHSQHWYLRFPLAHILYRGDLMVENPKVIGSFGMAHSPIQADFLLSYRFAQGEPT
jgi:hypothetical protein